MHAQRQCTQGFAKCNTLQQSTSPSALALAHIPALWLLVLSVGSCTPGTAMARHTAAAVTCVAALYALCLASLVRAEVVVFEDDFNNGFNVSVWKHEITAGGEGNWVSSTAPPRCV